MYRLYNNRFRHILLFILIIFIYGCDKPVEILESKLGYHSGGPMHFGSASPFAISVKLKLPPGNYEQVKIVFIGDGKEIGIKTVTFMSSGRSDTINVEYGDRDSEFVDSKQKKLKVLLISGGEIVKGPYLLEVPDAKLRGL